MRALGMVRGQPECDRVAAFFVPGEVLTDVEALALQRAVEPFDPAVSFTFLSWTFSPLPHSAAPDLVAVTKR